jgi:hypothetical protein
MVDKYKDRGNAESVLVEFFITLRYYSDIWYRARILSNLLNLVGIP